jgi:hypothetical protein
MSAPVSFHKPESGMAARRTLGKSRVKLNFRKFPRFDACDAHYEKLPKLLLKWKIRNKEREGFCPDLPNIINWEKD